MPLTAVTVLGAGSWGTALAILLARIGHRVQLCDKDSSLIGALAADRENKRYLPGCRLPDNITPQSDVTRAVADIDACLLAVPSDSFRTALKALVPKFGPGC